MLYMCSVCLCVLVCMCDHMCVYVHSVYVCMYIFTFCRPLSQSRVAGKGNVFLGASNKRAKVIVLQINGLSDAVSL